MINARNPACKITGGAGLKHPNLKFDKNGLKRHFFYHPVRVNKELIDEELPCPDTVRNVRKLFEGSSLLRVRSASKDNIAVNSSTLAIQSVLGGRASTQVRDQVGSANALPVADIVTTAAKAGCPSPSVISDLAVDTSTGGVAQAMRMKWDAASLSSGVSSGELSSPCECAEIATEMGNHISIYPGDDHMDDGKCCDPSYVSQVIFGAIVALSKPGILNINTLPLHYLFAGCTRENSSSRFYSYILWRHGSGQKIMRQWHYARYLQESMHCLPTSQLS